MKKVLLTVFCTCFAYVSFAGTLIFKDGTKISGVTIVSISDGKMVIEKDKAKRQYPIKKLRAFYQTDLSDSNDMPDEFADYNVSILDIQVPKQGVDSKKKSSKAIIEYSISRKGSKHRIKFPYFYFYVITPGKNEVSGRKVYRYYYPKQAKPKGKAYDEAAILAELADFGRPVWNAKNRNLKGKLNGRKVEFSLKSIGKRKIIAWHLEVWGNDKKLIDKSGNVMNLDGRRVGKRWWKRPQY